MTDKDTKNIKYTKVVTKAMKDDLEINLSTYLVTMSEPINAHNIGIVTTFLMQNAAKLSSLTGQQKKTLVLDTLPTLLIQTDTLKTEEK